MLWVEDILCEDRCSSKVDAHSLRILHKIISMEMISI